MLFNCAHQCTHFLKSFYIQNKQSILIKYMFVGWFFVKQNYSGLIIKKNKLNFINDLTEIVMILYWYKIKLQYKVKTFLCYNILYSTC